MLPMTDLNPTNFPSDIRERHLHVKLSVCEKLRCYHFKQATKRCHHKYNVLYNRVHREAKYTMAQTSNLYAA